MTERKRLRVLGTFANTDLQTMTLACSTLIPRSCSHLTRRSSKASRNSKRMSLLSAQRSFWLSATLHCKPSRGSLNLLSGGVHIFTQSQSSGPYWSFRVCTQRPYSVCTPGDGSQCATCARQYTHSLIRQYGLNGIFTSGQAFPSLWRYYDGSLETLTRVGTELYQQTLKQEEG